MFSHLPKPKPRTLLFRQVKKLYLVVTVFAFERLDVRVRQQVLGQLVLQAEDLGAEGAGVVPALVVGRRQVLLQPVAVVKHLEKN